MPELTTILTHLGAAAAPFVLIFIGRLVVRRRRFKRFERDFWSRQNLGALKAAGILDGSAVPAPPKTIDDRWALETALQAMSLAREHGVLDLLADRPGLTAEAIAERLGFAARQVRAGLEMLLAAGIIERSGEGYGLTATAKTYLSSGSPLFDVTLPPPKVTTRQLKVLQSGIVRGAAARWARGRAAAPLQWAASMHRHSFPLGFALHDSGLLHPAERVLDVAGGAGSVCIALALRDPALELRMIELPGSLRIAERMISQYELTSRIECIGMDMFADAWPSDNDVVLFTNIFHDWDDARCRILASKARTALRPGGRVFLQEALLNDDGPGPLWTAHLSLQMAMTMQGRQFRRDELKATLAESGFEDVEVLPLLGFYSAVIGRKPGG